MRGSLVVLCAGLAGELLSAGCHKSKSKEAPPPSTGSSRGATGATPGSAVAAGPGSSAPAPGGSPGATGPDPSFELSMVQPSAAPGATATAKLVVHPGPGLHMNTDYPTNLTLTPPAGVTVPKPSLVVGDADKFDRGELAFSVPMSAAAQGSYKVPGTFKFAVCDEGSCYPKKRAVELLLTVQ
ncbi:MAG TPA: protein-disulfide reductase DsbD domain-containing protein [Kofleriaceae bacterium]|nr:protein-disulfide reductase DsbD domain-containing protein [Kofleriaceae bacterium]